MNDLSPVLIGFVGLDEHSRVQRRDKLYFFFFFTNKKRFHLQKKCGGMERGERKGGSVCLGVTT